MEIAEIVRGYLDTDKRFTGQRLDDSGLYFYNARYYDSQIGRFISADTVVPDPSDPQNLNRYTYCLNNPLKYTDPSGNLPIAFLIAAIVAIVNAAGTAYDAYQCATDPSPMNFAWLALGFVDPSGTPWGAGTDIGRQGIKQLGREAGEQASERAVREVGKRGLGVAEERGAREIGEGATKSFSRRDFRENLVRLSGENPAGARAHHVFPIEHIDKFKAAGIDIHDPTFGVWWETGDHLRKAGEYNRKWGNFLKPGRTREEIMDFGRRMAKENGLTIYF